MSNPRFPVIKDKKRKRCAVLYFRSRFYYDGVSVGYYNSGTLFVAEANPMYTVPTTDPQRLLFECFARDLDEKDLTTLTSGRLRHRNLAYSVVYSYRSVLCCACPSVSD